MEQGNLMKAGGLFAAALLLIGLIVLSVNRSGRMESQLFEELEEMTELDFELCPFDGRLTRTSRAVLFDFSDPLPAELADYPGKLMENMMAEMEDARRFDRFSLYTLNPFGNTPKALNAFCIPVTLKQIPSDIRRTLWGKDPEEHRTLPERYLRFAEVFERLWENERTLDASLQESMKMLESQSTSSQGYSRIIENLEEIVLSELDRNSREVKVTILSDMLQNSPEFSHYGSSWDFERYLASRRSEPFDMERVSFDVYFVQTCDSLESARRRALQGFWNDYFDHFNASADFKLLRISGDDCAGTNVAAQPPARQAQSPGRQAQAQPARRTPARNQGQQRSAAEDLLDELGLHSAAPAKRPARRGRPAAPSAMRSNALPRRRPKARTTTSSWGCCWMAGAGRTPRLGAVEERRRPGTPARRRSNAIRRRWCTLGGQEARRTCASTWTWTAGECLKSWSCTTCNSTPGGTRECFARTPRTTSASCGLTCSRTATAQAARPPRYGCSFASPQTTTANVLRDHRPRPFAVGAARGGTRCC